MVDVIDALSRSQVTAVMLSGGDPMIHPHFFDVAGYAIERVSVTVAGLRADPARRTARAGRAPA